MCHGKYMCPGELPRALVVLPAGRRHLAKLGGLFLKDLRHHLTLSFAKVAEYQRRGVVHSVIRLDGPGAPKRRHHPGPPPMS
ncbi:MAG TPA: replication initiator [Nonomuraea sp.]|nr:replication initiator [Nonomuraea sp.]